MKYSLANYICSIQPSDQTLLNVYGTISIGGEGSTTASMSASRDDSLFQTTSYSTGGYVHNKNLSKMGKISLSLNQLADNVSKLKRLVNSYTTNDYSGLTITLTTSDGEIVCTGIDCVPEKIPEQAFANSAADQTWTFTCGEINFE